MPRVSTTMTRKKRMAESVGVPIVVCMSAPRLLVQIRKQPGHLDVLDAVRPGDVDGGEHPGGYDHADADRDAERRGLADLLPQERLVYDHQQEITHIPTELDLGQEDVHRP